VDPTTRKTTGEYTWQVLESVPSVGLMGLPDLLGPASVQPGSSAVGSMDRLVADGRAIGVRVVLDLTAAVPASRTDDPPPLVVVPDSLADLLDGFPTYGS
jgi:hypothetical protein